VYNFYLIRYNKIITIIVRGANIGGRLVDKENNIIQGQLCTLWDTVPILYDAQINMLHHAYRQYFSNDFILHLIIYTYSPFVKFHNNFLCYSYRCAKQSKYAVCENSTFIPALDIVNAQGASFPLWLNTAILFGFLIVFRLLGYLVLRFIRKPKWIPKPLMAVSD